MVAQRLAVDARKMLIRLAVGPGEKGGQPSWRLRQLQDLGGDPVGLDQGDVVEQRANAVERCIRIPVDHLRADALELLQRVAAAVLEGGQPPAYLRVVGDWL